MSTSDYSTQRLPGTWSARLRAAAAAKPISAEAWIVGGLVMLAAAIRFGTIATQSFWADEALTAYESHLPFGAMVNTVLHVETTPPLYFLISWGWAHLFGIGEVALRSISALAGLALVPIAYLTGRDLVSRRAGLLAAAFIALNPFMIWYSQEARAYMLLGTLAGASFLWFVRALRDPSSRNLAWWAVFSSLALLTHFFAGFVIGPEAVWLLWSCRTRGARLAVAAVALVQLAVAPLALVDTTHEAGWIAATSKVYRIAQVPLEFGINTLYRSTTTTKGLIGGAVLVAIVTLLVAIWGDRVTRRAAALAGAVAAIGILAPLALSYVGQDYFLARNVMPVFLPLAVAVAAACVVPRARIAGALLAVVLIGTFVFSTIKIQSDQLLQRPAWRALTHLIGATTHPRAILAAGGYSAVPLKIYLPNVDWVQPQGRERLIYEIDIVGTRRQQFLTSEPPTGRLAGSRPRHRPMGSALPRSVAPRGSRLLSRVGLDQWVVARFVLRHPIRVDIKQLLKLAPRYFRRAPTGLLVFIQTPER